MKATQLIAAALFAAVVLLAAVALHGCGPRRATWERVYGPGKEWVDCVEWDRKLEDSEGVDRRDFIDVVPEHRGEALERLAVAHAIRLTAAEYARYAGGPPPLRDGRDKLYIVRGVAYEGVDSPAFPDGARYDSVLSVNCGISNLRPLIKWPRLVVLSGDISTVTICYRYWA